MEKIIPVSWIERWQLWVALSRKFGSAEDWFIQLEIQQLGLTERLLLDLERKALSEARTAPSPHQLAENPFTMNELVAHSRFWLLALYEVLRTFKEKVGGPNTREFAPLADLFREVEIARMPLAKHQLKGLHKSTHYPEMVMHREFGWHGWLVFDPKTKHTTQIYRTELANKLLTAMAF